MLIFWLFVFVASLIVLVKSADYLVDSAKEIGVYFSLPGFVVGVLIVGIGTSAPELASAIAAVLQSAPELVISNAIGSNIANILLIVGLSAILAKNIKVKKELLDLDIPLLLLATVLFLAVTFDGSVSQTDSIFLLAGLLYYITYSISSKNAGFESGHNVNIKKESLIFALSLLTLIFSAKFLISSTLILGELLKVPATALTLFAVALGTSLPELFVSVAAVKKGQADMALGNIFGSNVFNLLAVVGIPAMFKTLTTDNLTFNYALPALLLSTTIFAFSGLSRKIHSFEGVFYLILYVYFVAKIFAFV